MDPYRFPGEESEDENENYDLLDANTYSNSGFDSNLRDCGIGFGGFDNDEDAYANAGGLLNASPLESDVFATEVYRSVGAIDFATQHQESTFGESHLDEPIEFISYGTSKVRDVKPREVFPRVFERLRLEHTHMYVACPLDDFVKKLDSLFESNSVDFTFEESSCFWRAMYYPKEPTPAVNFRVYMNSCPALGANRYLVEFVRRSGCGMAFNDLFSTIRGTMIAMKLVTKDNGEFVNQVEDLPCPVSLNDICWENKTSSSDESDERPRRLLVRSTSSSSSQENALNSVQDDFEDLSVVGCSDQDLFAPIVDMSRSVFEDVHVQGLSLVAHECKQGRAERLVNAAPDVVKLLLERISDSQNNEVKRNSCVALCEIAKETKLVPALIEHGAAQVLAQVAAMSFNPALAEIQRQAAQCLANMCTVPDGVKAVYEAVKDKFETFKQLEGQDTRLTDSIANVRKALQAC